jgi:hypothetical protein
MAGRRRKPFARLPAAVQRCFIQRQLHEIGQPVDFELVENLRTNLHQPIAAGPGHCLILDTPPERSASNRWKKRPSIPPHCGLHLHGRRRRGRIWPGKGFLELTDKQGMKCVRRPNAEYFDADKVGARPFVCATGGRATVFIHRLRPGGQTSGHFHQPQSAPAERRRRVLAATARAGFSGWRGCASGKLSSWTKRPSAA